MKARCLIGVFRDISKQLDTRLSERIVKEGMPIRVTHIPLFYVLPETGESKPFNEIVKEMDISKSSLSDLIKRYENKDIIYRENSSTDRRVVNFGMTQAGINIKKMLIKIEDDLLTDLMQGLSESEKEQLESLLRRI